METTFNCLVLRDETLNSLNELSVDFYKKNGEIFTELDKKRYDIKIFKVNHLKDYICDICDVNKSDKQAVKLWKVNVVDEVGIKEKLKVENEMRPRQLFSNYFQNELNGVEFTVSNIHVIAIIPTSTTGPSQQGVPQGGVNWLTVDSVYNWIIKLRRPSEIKKPLLVSSFGADFPLQGRDETLRALLDGNRGRNGISQRLECLRESKVDKENHPIPTLANGPGTGKSRFLQELPTLLRDHTVNENLRILSVNVTYNGNTNALEDEITAGPASVALRILYEHFLSGGTMPYTVFFSMCSDNWRSFSIRTALNVMIRDVGGDINLVVLGIDELNLLHSLALLKKIDANPVQEIVRSVGSLSTTIEKITYVPVLAGTIQGPLETMIQESTYHILRLPLRLLLNKEVNILCSYMEDKLREDDKLREYIDINNKTFRRCVSDLGGQVRAMEYFYRILSDVAGSGTHTVDYLYILMRVKGDLMERYPFVQVVDDMKQVVAHCILNIPVNKTDKTKKGVTYVELSSKGIINLEDVPHDPDAKCYVRMPYMWVWIFTSLDGFEEGKFWDVMIDQESHILWQNFEDFNMRYWVLRLQLLKVLYKTVTLRDLFNGAYYNTSLLLDHEFQLPTVEEYCVELEYQHPHKMQNEHLSPGTVFKNGEGAPYDIFFFLGDWLIVVQSKSSNATAELPQALSKRMVDKEYKKVEDAIEVMKKSFEIKNWVLFICTNGPKTADCLKSLPKNCFVVYRENFKDFYGNTFSTRAEFAADNDQLDANFAEEYELRTIDGIGKTIASYIKEEREKRPFEDENDLYNKVNIPMKARKRIKVTKINCN